MKQEKNKSVVNILLIFTIVALSVLCILFATDTINLKKANNENNNVDNATSSLLNGNVIVTENGKVISNEIPNDLVGKYINKNSSDSYIQLINGSVEVSEPTGGGLTRVFKNDQVKLYINFLNTNENGEQYVTVEFFVEKDAEGIRRTYNYIGEKNDNKYYFNTPYPTPVGGEEQSSYRK